MRVLARPTGPLRASAVMLALLACGSAWIASPAAARGAPRAHQAARPPLGGVNIVGLYPGVPLARADRAIASARALHAKVVRAELEWSALEPRGPGQIDAQALAFTDRLIADAARSGIRVILFVYDTPCWASSAPAELLQSCVPEESSAAAAWPPRDPADYAAAAAYLARRYGTRLAAIEVWNEPDQISQEYFGGPEKARHYAAILRATYTAVKQANPNVPVLGGSLVGSDGTFLRALYAAGIRGYYDGLAVHFYTLSLDALRSFRQVQLANGDSKPLWLDEFGWDSCYPQRAAHEEQPCVSRRIQARNITDTFRSLARTPYMAATVLYNLQDAGHEQFGVLTASGSRKPAFAALASVLASPFGLPDPVTLDLRPRGRRLLASGSGPTGDYMKMEAFQGNVLRYVATFTLDRFDRYSIALPGVLGVHGLRVRVYQLWSGPSRAAQRSF